MADIEKVKKGLECCVYGDSHTRCHKCPYWGTGKNGSSECQKMKKDALELLKEQEPKPVGKEWNECPSCGKALDRIHDMHYCGVCGQAVKWE